MLRARSPSMFPLVWGVLWRLGAIALSVYVVYRARFILAIILLSAVLTFAVNPLVNRACRWRPRFVSRQSWRFASALAVFVALIVASVFVVMWLWSPFQEQLRDLQRSVGHYQAVLQARLKVLHEWYQELPPSLREALAGEPFAGAASYLFGVANTIIASTLSWAQHIWELILIPVLAFYFCYDSRSLKRELMFLVPYRRVRETLFILRQASRIMENYVVAQFILCVVAGITVGVALWLIRVPYPLVLGVVAGITRAVPIVGPILGAIPITLVALTVSTKTGVTVLLFFCVLHLVESKVLLPELIGHSIKLHPAVILIVLLVGAEFFGILGMFLAAPVTAILRMLLNVYVVEPEMRRRKEAVAGPESMVLPEAPCELPDEEDLRKVS
ncbi:MAG: AI-2E family transporter [Armatimonadota bacterium]|nr:AI-2E family transporter [Armatimonadota bacterium]